MVEKLISFLKKSNQIKEDSQLTMAFEELFFLFSNYKAKKDDKNNYFDMRKIYYLAKIDAYVNTKSNSFTKLYDEVQGYYYKNVPQVFQVLSDLRSSNYKNVADHLQILGKKIDEISVNNLKEVKKELTYYFKSLIEKTKQLAKNEINLQDEVIFQQNLKSLEICYKNLKIGHQFLESYLLIEGIDLKKEIVDILQILEVNVCLQIDDFCKSFLEIENIKIVDMTMNNIESFITIFNDFCLSKIEKHIKNAKIQKTEILNKIVEKMNNFNIHNRNDLEKLSFYLNNFLLTSKYKSYCVKIFEKIENDLESPLKEINITPEKENFLKKSLENLKVIYNIIEKHNLCYLKEIMTRYKEMISKYQDDENKLDFYLQNQEFQNINDLIRKSKNSCLKIKIENYFEKNYNLNSKLLEFYDGMQNCEPKIWKKLSKLTEVWKIFNEIEILRDITEKSKNELRDQIQKQLLEFLERLRISFSLLKCDNSLTFNNDAHSLFVYVYEAIKVLAQNTNRVFLESANLVDNYLEIIKNFNDSFEKMIMLFKKNLSQTEFKIEQFIEIYKISLFYDKTLLFISTINIKNADFDQILSSIQEKYAQYSYLKIIEKIEHFYESKMKAIEMKKGINSLEKFKMEINIIYSPKKNKANLFLSHIGK